MTLYFDIETEPLPEAELRALCPEFDPAAVKLGNLTDPVKIRTKIEEAEKAHWEDFAGGAALSPLTGRVAAIGVLMSEGGQTLSFSSRESGEPGIIDCTGLHTPNPEHATEAFGLARFWAMVEGASELVGFNTHGFDLPFLIKRSWMGKVGVPAKMRLDKDRWWPGWNIDLYKLWQLGDARGGGRLDAIARALGLAGKAGEHGAEFGRMWRSSDPEERAAAGEYLRQDVRLCLKLRERLGFGAPVAAPEGRSDQAPDDADDIPM